MLTILLRLLLALFFSVAAAQAAEPTGTKSIEIFNQRLDRARSSLDEIEKLLTTPNVSDATLKLLRERIAPLPGEINEVIETLTPRLQAVEARVNELGAKRAEPPPPPPSPPPAPPAPAKPEVKPSAKAPAKPAAKPAAGKPAVSQPAAAPAPPPAAEKPAATPAAPTPPDTDAAALSAALASVNAEYAEQKQYFDEIDATLKRARALLLETQQIVVAIVAHQRDLFAKTVFLRSSGLFSPTLWKEALAEASTTLKTAGGFLTARAEVFFIRLNSGSPGLVKLLGLLILIAVAPLTRLSHRMLVRSLDQTPTELQKAAGAAWTAIVLAAVPAAAVAGLWAIADGFDLFDSSFDPVVHAFFAGAVRVALSYALAVAVLEPEFPQWRLWNPGDPLAGRLVQLATFASIVLAVGRVIETLEEIVQAGLPVVVVSRGLSVVAVAALTIGALSFTHSENGAPRSALAKRDWVTLTRVVASIVVAVVLLASAFGYVTFAAFFIIQLGWVAAVAALLQILLSLSTAAIAAMFEPSHLVARLLINLLGVSRQKLAQLSVLLSGVATLLCWGGATLLALTPFGVESGNMLGALESSFFSLKIGDVVVSPYNALIAGLLFAVTITATQALRRWLDQRYLPLTSLDPGLRNSISTSLGYAGFLIAVSVALSQVGVGLERLAIVAGALSVGIGFGLQSIVGNFVSGLILLWERAIRVGDWVVVGDEQGYVKRINVRSTEIETFDRATMIVPNSNLVSGVVKNWLRGDKVGRIKIALAPHSGVDPEHMRDVLLAAARAQEGVLRIPAPQVMFLGIEGNTFKFELWCFVEDVEQATRIRSDLHFDLHKRLAEAGITLTAATSPPAPTVVQLPGLEKLAAAAAVATAAIELGIGSDKDKDMKTDDARADAAARQRELEPQA